MAINLTSFSKILRSNTRKSGDTMQAVRTLDRAKPAMGFARIHKGQSPMIDDSVAAFLGNTAFQTRRRDLKFW